MAFFRAASPDTPEMVQKEHLHIRETHTVDIGNLKTGKFQFLEQSVLRLTNYLLQNLLDLSFLKITKHLHTITKIVRGTLGSNFVALAFIVRQTFGDNYNNRVSTFCLESDFSILEQNSAKF